MQPECETCGHPITFHGSGKSRCKALACLCTQWKGPTLIAATTISLTEAASRIGKSSKFVKEHAKALGGKEVLKREVVGGTSRAKVWRFPPAKLDERYPRLQARLDRKAAR